MKRYVYFQPNDKDLKDEVGDCAIRAVCKAFNLDWLAAFDRLCVYARKNQCLPNQDKATKPFLEDAGWHYTSVGRGKRITVADLAKTFSSCDGPMIAHVRVGYRTHLVTIQAGKYYDTWDCGNKLIYGYWSQEEDV